MFLDKIALVLAIIGGLNWGSIGIFQFDLVGFLFGGQSSTFSRVIHFKTGLPQHHVAEGPFPVSFAPAGPEPPPAGHLPHR